MEQVELACGHWQYETETVAAEIGGEWLYLAWCDTQGGYRELTGKTREVD